MMRATINPSSSRCPAPRTARGAPAAAAARRRRCKAAAARYTQAPLYARPDLAVEGRAEEFDAVAALRSYTAAAASHPRFYSMHLAADLRAQSAELAAAAAAGGAGADAADAAAAARATASPAVWEEIL
jgi:hypothetical protein